MNASSIRAPPEPAASEPFGFRRPIDEMSGEETAAESLFRDKKELVKGIAEAAGSSQITSLSLLYSIFIYSAQELIIDEYLRLSCKSFAGKRNGFYTRCGYIRLRSEEFRKGLFH